MCVCDGEDDDNEEVEKKKIFFSSLFTFSNKILNFNLS